MERVTAEPGGEGPGRVGVVRAGESHLEALAGFIRQVWDPKATPERVRAGRARAASANPIASGQEVPIFLFVDGDEAVGHLATIPVQLQLGRTTEPAHWLSGLWVLPEFRDGPIGFYLVRAAVEELGTCLAVVVEEAPRRLYEALGFTDLGTIPNYVKLLKPSRAFRVLDPRRLGMFRIPTPAYSLVRIGQRIGVAGLAGAGFKLIMGLWARSRGRATHAHESRDAMPDAAALDELWGRVAPGLGTAVVRDGFYLTHRYGSGGRSEYRTVTVATGQGLEALAIVRAPSASSDPRLAGIRLAVLSDLLFDPHRIDLGLSVVRGAERTALELGADALLCTASDERLGALLRRRGFLRLGGNQHFVFRASESGGGLPGRLGDWWLLRGDARADGTL